jgi:hypothetical protein
MVSFYLLLELDESFDYLMLCNLDSQEEKE